MNKTYIMVPVKPVKHDLVSEIDKFIHVPLATRDNYGSVKIGSGLIVEHGLVSLDFDVLPKDISQLKQDSEHRLVTDNQINYWNNKIDNSDVLGVEGSVATYKGSEIINKNSLDTNLKKYYTKIENDELLSEKTDNTTTEKLTERVFENETNIDVLTQNKANKSDIIDNLTTNNSNQMLSARQGYRLNNMINDINALLKSDNVNLDTIQEIVNYIENNKDLIDSIMLTKVNISDVIDNLTTTDSNKPLSANQGVVLKGFIDAIPSWAKQPTKPTYYYSEILERPSQIRVSISKTSVPTKTSQLINDGDGTSNFITEQTVTQMVSHIEASIPNKTSDILNDGDGSSPYATEQFVLDNAGGVTQEYVDNAVNAEATARETADRDLQSKITTNSTDIESLKTADTTLQDNIDREANERASADNNLQSQINEKANISSVPTKTSDLINDSGFTTETYVDNAISSAITTALNTEV